MNSRNSKNDFVNFICSGIGGLVAQLIYYPSNALYDRFVEFPHKKSLSNLPIILFPETNQTMLQKIKPLYKGFGTGELKKIAGKTFKYGFQPIAVSQLTKLVGEKENENNVFIEGAAGAMTTFLKIVLFYPFDTIKTKRQNDNTLPIRQIIKIEKLNLYNAAELEIANKLIGSFILFSMTAAMLRLMGVNNEHEASMRQFSIAAGIASGMDALFTTPFSVVKSNIQKADGKVSTVSMFKKIIEKEGPRGLYKGTLFNIITAQPKKALPLVVTEYLLTQFQK